jgi:hypothetical protein
MIDGGDMVQLVRNDSQGSLRHLQVGNHPQLLRNTEGPFEKQHTQADDEANFPEEI